MTHPLDHVDDALRRGLDLLQDPTASSLGAVACLSAHQSAFCSVVEPALLRHGCTRDDLAGLHRLSHDLGRALRVLERAASGDVAASGLDRARLAARAAELTRRTGAVEARLLDRLGAALEDEEAADLVTRYEHALQHAPTRPHAANPHNRVLRRVNAWRDHVLDVMDARLAGLPAPVREHVPTGRERRAAQQDRTARAAGTAGTA